MAEDARTPDVGLPPAFAGAKDAFSPTYNYFEQNCRRGRICLPLPQQGGSGSGLLRVIIVIGLAWNTQIFPYLPLRGELE